MGRTCRRWFPMVMASFVLIAVVGCGSDHPGVGRRPEPWDPCTGIGDRMLRRTGLDPATVIKDIGGAHYPGWDVCGWKPIGYKPTGPTAYSVGVMSTNTESLDRLRHDPFNTQLVDVTIGGRRGLQYYLGAGDSEYDCTIAFDTAAGVVRVIVDRTPAGDYSEPVCVSAQRAAAQLLPVLPQ